MKFVESIQKEDKNGEMFTSTMSADCPQVDIVERSHKIDVILIVTRTIIPRERSLDDKILRHQIIDLLES